MEYMPGLMWSGVLNSCHNKWCPGVDCSVITLQTFPSTKGSSQTVWADGPCYSSSSPSSDFYVNNAISHKNGIHLHFCKGFTEGSPWQQPDEWVRRGHYHRRRHVPFQNSLYATFLHCYLDLEGFRTLQDENSWLNTTLWPAIQAVASITFTPYSPYPFCSCFL